MSKDTKDKVLAVLANKLRQLLVIQGVWTAWKRSGLSLPNHEVINLINEIGDTTKLIEEVRSDQG